MYTLKPDLWRTIATPLLLSSAITWLTLHPFFEISYRTPFLFYFGIIFISAAVGGSRASLVATISSLLLSCIYILPEYEPDSNFFLAANLIFLIEGLLLYGMFLRIEKTQRSLRKKNGRFRTIIERSTEGLILTDDTGTIQYLSSAVEKLIGKSLLQLTPIRLQDLMDQKHINDFSVNLLQMVKGQIQEFNFLSRLRLEENRCIWIEGLAMDMRDDPSISMLVFQYRDVTARIELESQKNDFLQITSHELKSPITSIKGFTQFLKRKHVKAGLSEDLQIIEKIEGQTTQLMRLIEDLQDVARLKNGSLPYTLEMFEMDALIREILEDCKDIYPEHQFIYSNQTPANVNADRQRIARAIWHLISNAVKFAPDAQTIQIMMEADNLHATVKIIDKGIGIPASQQTKIFEPFYRYNKTSTFNQNGLGTGLYISSQIISSQSGEMGVVSELGEGACFWFALPRVYSHEAGIKI